MKNKKKISEKEFIRNVDPQKILDEDETWESYRSDMESQDTVEYFRSGNIYFFQTAGFEYFWKKN